MSENVNQSNQDGHAHVHWTPDVHCGHGRYGECHSNLPTHEGKEGEVSFHSLNNSHKHNF